MQKGYPEDKIEHTDPIRWDMCKYIRDWQWVRFGFRHPSCQWFSKAETNYAVAVLLKLDRTPDYIRVALPSELSRPYFVFSYRPKYDPQPEDKSYHFSAPPESFINKPLPSLDNPGGAALYIDNFLQRLKFKSC